MTPLKWLLALGAMAALGYGLRRAAAHSNTQVHLINQ